MSPTHSDSLYRVAQQHARYIGKGHKKSDMHFPESRSCLAIIVTGPSPAGPVLDSTIADFKCERYSWIHPELLMSTLPLEEHHRHAMSRLPDSPPSNSIEPISLTSDELYETVYDELKRIAHHHLRTNAALTLSTTELVHEAFLRLRYVPDGGWEGRGHFFGAASRAMRQILVAFARRRRSLKRGGAAQQVSLTTAADALEIQLDEVIALDDALDRLDAVNPRLRQIVELRFFAGLNEFEIAAILRVTTRTVERDWLKARLILLRELSAP